MNIRAMVLLRLWSVAGRGVILLLSLLTIPSFILGQIEVWEVCIIPVSELSCFETLQTLGSEVLSCLFWLLKPEAIMRLRFGG